MSSVVWTNGMPEEHVRVAALVAATLPLGLAAWRDARTHRIPNRLLGAAGAITLAGAVMTGPGTVARVALGALLAGVPMLVVLLARSIGMGDVKMAAVAGATGGLVHPLVGAVAVLVMALTVAALGALTGRPRWALGPFIWIAFVGTAVLAVAPLAGGRR